MVEKKTNIFGHRKGREIEDAWENPLPDIINPFKAYESIHHNIPEGPSPGGIFNIIASLTEQGVKSAWDSAVTAVTSIGKPNIPEKPVNPANKSKGGHSV